MSAITENTIIHEENDYCPCPAEGDCACDDDNGAGEPAEDEPGIPPRR